MTPARKPKDKAKKSIEKSNKQIDDVVEILLSLMVGNFDGVEVYKRLGLAVNDLRVTQKDLDNALDGVYEEKEPATLEA